MDRATFLDMVALANTAPSVHNTQPARWALQEDGTLWLGADLSRHLPGSDPTGHDMGLSCGTALAATLLALDRVGYHGAQVATLWNQDDRTQWPGHRMAATLRVRPGPPEHPSPQAGLLELRQTWRGGFAPLGETEQRTVDRWAKGLKGTVWVTGKDAQTLVGMGDAAAVELLRTPTVRQELVEWMRPNARSGDGLTRQALGMGRLVFQLANLVLGGALFERLDAKGLVARVASEQAASRDLAGFLLVHVPRVACPVQAGMHVAHVWMEATAQGLSAWPMAALVDQLEAREAIAKRWRIGPERRLVMALRLGKPTGRRPLVRLPAEQVGTYNPQRPD
jgi:nitroreductase